MLTISQKNDFVELISEGSSSKVYLNLKENRIYKVNKRNSLKRQKSDLDDLLMRLGKFKHHVPETEIISCIHKDEAYTCVIQPHIKGKELKYLDEEKVQNTIKTHRDFFAHLLSDFFKSIKTRKLYPDLVGFPEHPTIFNSLNLILEEKTDKLYLCDVGLSPHEDTLERHGRSFFEGDNVKAYLKSMGEFKLYLESL